MARSGCGVVRGPGGWGRRDSWRRRLGTAEFAARSIGEEPGPPPPATFWSDQFGLRVQCIGNPAEAEEAQADGDQAERGTPVVEKKELGVGATYRLSSPMSASPMATA